MTYPAESESKRRKAKWIEIADTEGKWRGRRLDAQRCLVATCSHGASALPLAGATSDPIPQIRLTHECLPNGLAITRKGLPGQAHGEDPYQAREAATSRLLETSRKTQRSPALCRRSSLS